MGFAKLERSLVVSDSWPVTLDSEFEFCLAFLKQLFQVGFVRIRFHILASVVA
jgi:hypothetical protein